MKRLESIFDHMRQVTQNDDERFVDEKKTNDNHHTIPLIIDDDVYQSELISYQHYKPTTTKTAATSSSSSSSNSNNNNNNKSCIKSFYSTMKYHKGILYALFSALTIALSTVLIKRVNLFNGSDISLVRFTMQFALMFAIIKHKRLTLLGPKVERASLCFRGLFGAVSVISMNFAVKYMLNPSDSQSIYECSIIFTAILSRIILCEKLNIGHLVSIILTIVGIAFIWRPQFLFNNDIITIITASSTNISKSYYSIGIVFSLTGAFSAALVPVLIKHLANHSVPNPIITIYSAYVGMPSSLIVSLVLMFINDTTMNDEPRFRQFITVNKSDLIIEIICVLLSAFFGLIAQIAWNFAIQYKNASESTLIRSLNVAFVFLLQYAFLQIEPDFWSIIGASAIVSGTCFIIGQLFADW